MRILSFKERMGTETSEQVRTGKQLGGGAALSSQMCTMSPKAGGTRPRQARRTREAETPAQWLRGWGLLLDLS